jgi:hypothetical protein
VETIGGWSFNGCENITKITLGANVKTIGNYAFSSNGNLQTITVKAYNAPVINKNVFSGVNNPVTVYYPYGSDYSTWMEMFPNWTFVTDMTPTECLELSITADDVNGNSTSTTIHWTATVRGVNIFTNETVVKTVSGTDTSETFPQNTSETNTVERTVSYTLLGVTATATFTQGVFVPAYYTVDLNGQWRKSTTISNPNSNLYDGVYESFSNINKNNSTAYAYVDINGYEEFTMYIRSNGEDDYDYMLVSQLDIPSITLSDRTNTTKVKAHTRGNANAGTGLNSYTKVTWTGIDQGPHRICILYGKDSSSREGTDQGYFFIPKA